MNSTNGTINETFVNQKVLLKHNRSTLRQKEIPKETDMNQICRLKKYAELWVNLMN